MLFIIFFPEIFVTSKNAVDPMEVQKLDSLEALLKPRTTSMRFPFNPNTVSYDSLSLLGVPEHIANRILKYRENGGRFKKKEDLRKIYGISSELVDSLYDWIEIPEINVRSNDPQNGPWDINLAEWKQLKNIKLIGDVLAGRIIKYRDLLGGFVSKSQFKEVYGLSDEAIVQLTSSTYIENNFTPRLIRINHCNLDDLLRHPYISNKLAYDIIQYREVKSTIESEKVLAVFKSVDKSNFEKLILYLDFQ
jgi:DNA uptake protein ComE-like DNA-binding protein